MECSCCCFAHIRLDSTHFTIRIFSLFACCLLRCVVLLCCECSLLLLYDLLACSWLCYYFFLSIFPSSTFMFCVFFQCSTTHSFAFLRCELRIFLHIEQRWDSSSTAIQKERRMAKAKSSQPQRKIEETAAWKNYIIERNGLNEKLLADFRESIFFCFLSFVAVVFTTRETLEKTQLSTTCRFHLLSLLFFLFATKTSAFISACHRHTLTRLFAAVSHPALFRYTQQASQFAQRYPHMRVKLCTFHTWVDLRILDKH